MPMRHLSRIVPGKAAVLLFCFCAWIFFPHSGLIPCILNTVHPLIPPAPKVCDIFAVLRVMLLAVRAEQKGFRRDFIFVHTASFRWNKKSPVFDPDGDAGVVNAWKACEALRIRRPRRSRSRKRDLAVCPVSGACKQQSGGTAAPAAPCRASSRTAAANITLLWSSRVFFRNQRRAQKSTRGISPACGRFFSCFISAGVNIFFNLTGRVCFCKFIQHCKNIIGMV